jgi:thiol-disulfide isomerase/thioredoxin
MKKGLYLTLALLFLLVLAACSASGGSEPEEAMPETTGGNSDVALEEKEGEMAESADEAMMAEGDHPDEAVMEDKEGEEATSDEAMMEDKEGEEAISSEMADDAAMMDKPVWQTIALTDVRSGQTFTLADFAGKTVFVEPMATWCTNCRRQLGNVAEARNQLGEENIVYVALSVETTISDQALADYTEQTGFDWTFAVATPELLQELVATFGQSITNPPSTPHFVIRPDGSYTDLVTGIEPPSDIISQIQEAGG